ncbi:hypothetical protein HPP92_027674 [Vanilla planifolia]|uniref:Uncharacterized protein n=1 Tax=Vanilla planifolia TaxID=51239 RepID=A0A835PBM8_VANPL|nr:hypothetical protein HPP92_027674 [Vanilla planifolia]
MGRFLIQTLSRGIKLSGIRFHCIPRPPPSRIFGVRMRSGLPEAGRVIEFDLGSGSDGVNVEPELLTLQKLEDAIQGFFIEKAAPGWLPFVSGASYWAPPEAWRLGKLDIVDRPSISLTHEEELSRTTSHGWPSLPYFVDGVMTQRSTKISITIAKSDDEE